MLFQLTCARERPNCAFRFFQFSSCTPTRSDRYFISPMGVNASSVAEKRQLYSIFNLIKRTVR